MIVLPNNSVVLNPKSWLLSPLHASRVALAPRLRSSWRHSQGAKKGWMYINLQQQEVIRNDVSNQTVYKSPQLRKVMPLEIV